MATGDISLEEQVKQRLGVETWWLEYVEPVEQPYTISQVPANIREANKNLYEPRMVSIGPYYYHLRKDRLRAMENQKWKLLSTFLRRNSELNVETCIKVVRNLEKSARQSYGELIFLSQDEFVQMLLLDGCFILELFFNWLNDDDIFKEGWGPAAILSDLLLIENQIPFEVIEGLYAIVRPEEAKDNRNAFLGLLSKFLMDEEPSHPSQESWPEKIHHLLDLYYAFLIKPGTNQQEREHDPNAVPLWKQRLINWMGPRPDQQDFRRPPRRIPCATELEEVGVKFRKKLSPRNLFDVKFSMGIMEIPPLQIDSNTKALLTNLIALEKQEIWSEETVTSYVALMVSLINTKEDVALLQNAGVIRNMLSNHQEALVFFNRLGDGTSFDSMNHHFTTLFRYVELYYDSNWNRSLARLMHDYFIHFKSPWAATSAIAAMTLLGLSTLQTFYTIYQYYGPAT